MLEATNLVQDPNFFHHHAAAEQVQLDRIQVRQRGEVHGDLAVERVGEIGDLQRAGGDATIGQVMVQAANVFLWQAVAFAQTRPAVRAVDELVAEDE